MKKVLLVFAMGAFLFSCGGPDMCDCINATKEEKKDEEFKEACKELKKKTKEEYKNASKEDKKAMREEEKACKEEK